MTIPDANAAVDKEREAREVSSMTRETKCRVREVKKWGRTVHFQRWRAYVTSRTRIRGQRSKNTRCASCSREMLWKDILADTMCTEQDSSASQKKGPQKFWMLSRDNLDAEGHTSDAVYAYAQVKMEDAPKLLKLPKSKCPDIWIPLSRKVWRKT